MADQSVIIRFRALYESKLAGLQRDIDRVGASAGAAAGKAGSGLNALAKFSQVAGTALMVGVGAALAVGIKAAIDFESAFAGVRKTVDASEEEFQRLSDGIRAMSKEIPITAIELAKIAELGGQLGIPVEALDEFTDVIAKLGATTNLELDEAATGIARFTNVMGTSLDEFDNMGAAIVDLGNKFATTEKEILTFSTRLAGIGSAVGLTEEEVLGLATAFTSLGEPAERGASALQNTFIRLQDMASAGGEKLRVFADLVGMSTQDAKKFIEDDLLGAFVAMERGLNGVIDSGGNANEILDALGLGAIRTTTLLLKGAAGINTVESALRTANTAWEENAALEVEAGKRFETTQSQLILMGNAFTDLRIEMGNNLLPAFRDVLRFMSGFFDVLKDSMPVLKSVAAAVAVLAGARGLLKLGTALSGGTVTMTGFNIQGKAMRTWSQPASKNMQNLAGATSMFSTVLTFAVVGLGLLAVAVANSKQRVRQFETSVEDLIDTMEEAGNVSRDTTEAILNAFEQAPNDFGMRDLDKSDLLDFLEKTGTSLQDFTQLMTGSKANFDEWLSSVEGFTMNKNLIDNIREVREEMDAEKEFRRQEALLGPVFSPEAQRQLQQEAARMKTILKDALSPEQGLLDAIQFELGEDGDAADILDGMTEKVQEFGVEFSDAWAEIVSGLSEQFQGWQENWEDYEAVEAISIEKMREQLEIWNADQERLLDANAFIVSHFGASQQAIWDSLPEEIRRGAAATLAEQGPGAFTTLAEMLFEQFGLAVEQTDASAGMIMPRKIMEAIQNQWPLALEIAMADLPETVRANTELQTIAAEKAWTDWLSSLSPELAAGVTEFMGQLQAEFLANDDLVKPQNWMSMTDAETLAWLKSQGMDMSTAIALGFTSVNLAFIFGQHVADAAAKAVQRGTIGLGIGSPSKKFVYIGEMVGAGFQKGLEASWPTDVFTHMVTQSSQRPNFVPAPAVNVAPQAGPTIVFEGDIANEDKVLEKSRAALRLSGLVRYAETAPGRG